MKCSSCKAQQSLIHGLCRRCYERIIPKQFRSKLWEEISRKVPKVKK